MLSLVDGGAGGWFGGREVPRSMDVDADSAIWNM